METLWLIIVLFFVLIFIVPLFFKVYFSFNPLENEGMIVIKLFFINIIYFSFQIKVDGIVIRTKTKRKQIVYKFTDPKIRFYELLTLQLKHKVKIKYLDIFSEVGTGDAFSSALTTAVMNIFYHIIASYIKNLKLSSSISINSHTLFNKKTFEVRMFLRFSISLFDIFYCFFTSLFLNNSQKVKIKNKIK